MRFLGRELLLAEAQDRRIKYWHWWFAWYPVCIDYGDWRWLEIVARRFDGNAWKVSYKYMAKP